jgi:hypothetical protein
VSEPLLAVGLIQKETAFSPITFLYQICPADITLDLCWANLELHCIKTPIYFTFRIVPDLIIKGAFLLLAQRSKQALWFVIKCLATDGSWATITTSERSRKDVCEWCKAGMLFPVGRSEKRSIRKLWPYLSKTNHVCVGFEYFCQQWKPGPRGQVRDNWLCRRRHLL